MAIPTDMGFFVFTLPLLIAAASALAFSHAAIPSARQHAALVSVSITLLTALLCLVMALTELSPHKLTLLALTMLAAQIIAAPLLDRARMAGLVFASVVAALFLSSIVVLHLPPHTLLLLVLMCASVTGLIGSALIPAHPLRMSPSGSTRTTSLAQGWMGNGLVLLALACFGLGWLLDAGRSAVVPFSVCISALTTSWVCVLLARRMRHPYPLRMAGEGLVAGVMVALLVPASLGISLFAGVVAAICVIRGETIARSLRLDDMAHLTGMILLPSIAGLLLPGLFDLHVLAQHLEWLGATLLFAAVLALVCWPATMAIFGLAASPRRVREGLDFTL